MKRLLTWFTIAALCATALSSKQKLSKTQEELAATQRALASVRQQINGEISADDLMRNPSHYCCTH